MPKVVLKERKLELILPDQLSKFIKSYYPTLTIPDESDFDSEMLWYFRDRHNKKFFPYVCWNDFNGDGLIDVALILKSKKRYFEETPHYSYWYRNIKIISFHNKGKGDYEPYLLWESSHFSKNALIYLFLIKPGEITYLKPIKNKEGVINLEARKMELKYDGICFGFFEKASRMYYWDGEKYLSVTTGD